MESVSRKIYEIYEIQELIRACGTGNCIDQQGARIALEKIGEPAIDPLIEALMHDANPLVRSRAAEALGHIRCVRAIDPLINALRDRNSAVRWRAIEALVDIGEPAIEVIALAMRKRNIDIDMRWCLNRAMKDIKAKKMIKDNEEIYKRLKSISC